MESAVETQPQLFPHSKRGNPAVIETTDCIGRSDDREFLCYFRTGLKIYASRQFQQWEIRN